MNGGMMKLMGELDRRSADLKIGKDPGMTLEQAVSHLLT